jgi:hypothetical protein
VRAALVRPGNRGDGNTRFVTGTTGAGDCAWINRDPPSGVDVGVIPRREGQDKCHEVQDSEDRGGPEPERTHWDRATRRRKIPRLVRIFPSPQARFAAVDPTRGHDC